MSRGGVFTHAAVTHETYQLGHFGAPRLLLAHMLVDVCLGFVEREFTASWAMSGRSESVWGTSPHTHVLGPQESFKALTVFKDPPGARGLCPSFCGTSQLIGPQQRRWGQLRAVAGGPLWFGLESISWFNVTMNKAGVHAHVSELEY